MFKNYRWYILVMVTTLLGVIALQIFFTYQGFNLKTTEFQQKVNLSLEEAIKVEKLARIDSFLVYTRQLFADSSKVEITAKFWNQDQRTHFSIRDRDMDKPYTTLSFDDDLRILNHLDPTNLAITIDRIMQSVRNNLALDIIYYWTPNIAEKMTNYIDSTSYDKKMLCGLFEKNLTKRGVSTNIGYQIIENDSILYGIQFEESYQTPFFNTQLPDGKSIQIATIIEDPNSIVLGSLKLSILGSILSIVLVAFSFYFLFHIIRNLNKVSNIKDDLINSITHELQTPIATLMAANESMMKYQVLNDQEKSKRYLQVSKTALNRLSKLVDNILWNSLYNRELAALNTEEHNLHDIIKTTTKNYQLIHGNEVEFIHDVKEIVVKTDMVHLQNVLNNIIENAIKYNNSTPKTISISTKLLHQDVRINIEDNGIGIPTKYREKVFEKFFRDPETSFHFKGFGIGLYYVKNIIQKLGGTVKINSKSTQGTSVSIILPITYHEI